MKMSEKICTNCGNKVDGNVNFCPKCKSQSFRNVNELAKPKATFVQNLLYKYQNNYYVLSKAKVGASITFIVFGTLAFLGFILLMPKFFIGLAIGWAFFHFFFNPLKMSIKSGSSISVSPFQYAAKLSAIYSCCVAVA